MKKITALLLCAVLVLGMSMPVHAAENTTPIMPLALDPPTGSHSTPYEATITNLAAGHLTYTKFYFSPTEEDLKVYGVFYLSDDSDTSANYRVKINLYKVGSDVIEDSYTTGYFTNSYGFTHTFKNLLSNANYYFSFENITTSSLTNRSVMGNVYIE